MGHREAINCAIQSASVKVQTAPVFNARVFVGSRQITDVVRVEISGFSTFASEVNRQRVQAT